MTFRTEVTRNQAERHRRDSRSTVHSSCDAENDRFPERPLLTRRAFLIGAGAVAGSFLLRRPAAYAQSKILVGFIVPEDTAFAAEAESLIAGFELFLKENKVSSVEILKKSAGSNGKETLTGLAELVMKHEVRFLVSPPTLSGSEKCIHGIPPGKVVLFVTNPAVRLVS